MKRYLAILFSQVVLAALLGVRVEADDDPQPLAITDFELFDIGVVDADGDGRLDLFTSNHSAAQGVWLGDGQGSFRNALSEWELDQSPAFPGLEYVRGWVRPSRPGFYISRNGRMLRLRAHETERLGAVRGTLRVRAASAGSEAISIHKASRARSLIGAARGPDGEVYALVDFVVEPGGRLDLHTDVLALPHHFLVEGIEADQIFVGTRGVHPERPTFVLEWRDRHGQAWSDLQGDGVPDVFLARGALLGEIERFIGPAFVNAQLFVSTAGKSARFRDVAEEKGIRQALCRAYKPTWVDFDRDLDLDLYVGCRESANQLYQRQSDGTFREMAAALKLDIREGHAFAWFDVDGDGDSDLVAESAGALWLYENRKGPASGRWFERHVLSGRLKGEVQRIAPADFDGDGDFDAYVSVSGRSRLLVNEEGRLQSVETEGVGLPDRSLTASWVDFDLDGDLDFYTLPEGLYRQGADGQFRATGALARDAQRARVAWFDADTDGAWDLLVSTHTERLSWGELGMTLLKFEWLLGGGKDPTEAPAAWNTVLYRDLPRTVDGKPAKQAHWLQVELVGAESNRQAIGGVVELTTAAGSQLRRVGGADSSHYSQGHYRVYFGLGPHSRAERLRITWPGGGVTELENVEADRRLTLRMDEVEVVLPEP